MGERRIVLRTDGAARGNPGPAGAGFVIETPDGTFVHEGAVFLGERTNNQAEYDALLLALDAIAPDRQTRLVVYSDSELMVRQLSGEYRVKHEDLKDRYIRVTQHLLRARSFSVRHVPRAENKRADELANQAIDVHLQSQQGSDGQTTAGDAARSAVKRPQGGSVLSEESPGSTGQDARGGVSSVARKRLTTGGADARHPSG